MRLIPVEQRNKYKCLMCGSQPVKYFIKCTFPIDDEHEREYTFCSVCALKFSVNAHEHNRITISTGNRYPYNDRWDSYIIGFAFIDKETAFKNTGGMPLKDKDGNFIMEEYKHPDGDSTYGVKFDPITESNWRKCAKHAIDSEIETLDQYLRVEVYKFTLEEVTHNHYERRCPHCCEIIEEKDFEDREEVNSLSGFYGICLEENGIRDEICKNIQFDD